MLLTPACEVSGRSLGCVELDESIEPLEAQSLSKPTWRSTVAWSQ